MSSTPDVGKPLRRDETADYKAAYIAEYEAYKQAGRDDEAKLVADVLRDQYDHDVTKSDADAKKESAKAEAQPETTSAAKAPEDTAEPRAAARKTQPKK